MKRDTNFTRKKLYIPWKRSIPKIPLPRISAVRGGKTVEQEIQRANILTQSKRVRRATNPRAFERGHQRPVESLGRHWHARQTRRANS